MFTSAASRVDSLLLLIPGLCQTTWFKVTCLVVGAAALALSHRLRVQHITARLRDEMGERASERARVACDLHDTLLQGMQGLMLRFHFAAEQIPEIEPARALMEEALKAADCAIEEGRDRVERLRSSLSGRDLGKALAEVGVELNWEKRVQFSVNTEGSDKPVSPIIESELYFIGREAIANAFRHAGASQIQVEISSDGKMVQLRCQDDGIGIDPEMVRNRTENQHWGFGRMRERAEKVGGRLECWSTPGKGTEVSISMPVALPAGRN